MSSAPTVPKYCSSVTSPGNYAMSMSCASERARLFTWGAGEDRDAVLRELVELHRLRVEEPHVNMMPGHDADALARFLKGGLLVKGFRDESGDSADGALRPTR